MARSFVVAPGVPLLPSLQRQNAAGGRTIIRAFGAVSDVVLASWDPALATLGATRLLRGTYLLASLDGVVGGGEEDSEIFAVLSRDAGHGLETVAGRVLAATSQGVHGYMPIDPGAVEAPVLRTTEPPPALRIDVRGETPPTKDSRPIAPSPPVPPTPPLAPSAPMRAPAPTSSFTQVSPGNPPRRPGRSGLPPLDEAPSRPPETASLWVTTGEEDATALHTPHTPALQDPRLARRPLPAVGDRVEHLAHGAGEVEHVDDDGVLVRLRGDGGRLRLRHAETSFTLKSVEGTRRHFIGLPRA